MHEDAAGFALLGLNIYAYGLFVAAGLLAMLLCLAQSAKKSGLPQGAAAVFGAVGLPVMLIISRVAYCLLDHKFLSVFSLKAALSFWGGGFSMAGAMLGAVAAGLLAAKLLRIKRLRLLDLLTPALMLFVCFARLGEHFLETLGRSRPMTSAVANIGIITQNDGYDAYLRTYLFEALAAAAIALILIFRPQKRDKPGDTLLLGMLLWGCTQTLLESLRFDAHMRFSFVGVQQVFSAVVLACAVLAYAAQYGKARRIAPPVALSVAVMLFMVAAAIGLEFAIDRSGFNRILLYAAYALLVSAPVALGLWFKGRREGA